MISERFWSDYWGRGRGGKRKNNYFKHAAGQAAGTAQ